MALTYEELIDIQNKRKKREEQEQKATSKATSVASTKPYAQRLVSPADDIAPVKKFTPTTTTKAKATVTASTKKKEDERTWFKKSSYFDDGYDFGDITKTILGSVADVGESVVASVPSLIETGTDALAMLGTAMSRANINQANFNMMSSPLAVTKKGNKYASGLIAQSNAIQKETEKTTSEFVKKNLIDEQQVAKAIVSAPIKELTGMDVGSASVLGERSKSTVQSAGQMLTAIGLQAAGVPMPLTMGLSAYGSQSEKALNEGATFDQATMSATISAGAEVLSEYLSGGIKVKLPGQKAAKTLDEVLIKPLTEKITNKVAKTLVDIGVDATGEGFEELFSGVVSNLGEALYKEDNLGELINNDEARDEYLESFIAGMLLGGASSTASAVANRNAIELTENAQKVFDRVVEERIAEAVEENGGKAISKQKEAEIRKEVLRDMQRGYLKDDIESMFGGEKYTAYKDVLDKFDAYESKLNDSVKKYKDEYSTLQKEYDTLNELNLSEAKLGDKNRQTEIKNRQKEITDQISQWNAELKNLNGRKTSKKVAEIKESLSQYVSEMVKDDDLLSESYKEDARRYQLFQADFESIKGTKYEEAARKTLENAIKAKANNTNRMHDLVDMNAKLSADTGIVFEYKSGKQIKDDFIERQTKEIEKLEAIPEAKRTAEQIQDLNEMKDILEKVKSGESTVNGDISGDSIVLNMNSKNPLEVITGHEITHSLEGSEAYEKLKDTLFEYAKAKGVDVDGKLAELKAQYKGVKNANPENELLSDLVGEYLFTDYDFVKHLSISDPKGFKWLWNEIKYLCKIATAGSKEARELERVKRNFEKAYKESAKSGAKSEGVKHSLGYHAGDLGKSNADFYHNQSGSRGTGHFGTGVYFVGDESQINVGGYAKRPHHTVEFDNYNLYKVRNTDDGYALHRALHAIDSGFSKEFMEAAIEDSFKAFDVRSEASKLSEEYQEEEYNEELGMTVTKNYFEASIRAFTEVAEKYGIPIESFEKMKEEFDSEYFDENDEFPTYYTKNDYYDYLKETLEEADAEMNKGYDEFRNAYFKLWIRFGKKATNNALQKVIDHDLDVNPDGKRDWYREKSKMADSRATVFMKALGYEGIDVRGTELDNTGYGSVIYDLKGEDAEKRDEIGTAKYSLSDNNITVESTGYASGESYYTMSYTKDGKVVGTIEYGEYEGQPNVKMIEVEPEYRRQGIGTKLLQELQKKYPDEEISFGMSTPDGTKLLESVTYDVTDEAVVSDREKLKSLQTELNELQEKLDVLYDVEIPTEAQIAEVEKLGDRWNEVYDSINELEQSLRGKRATKTFVKTDADIRYSLTDSEGKELTDEQKEYFKDSKVSWGNKLMPVYHGTREEFHTFKGGYGESHRNGGLFWAAKDYEYAKDYSFSDSPIVKKGYLNITNLLDIGDIDSYGNYQARLQELADTVKLTPNELESMVNFKNPYIYDITSSAKFKERIVELGYDGVEAQESGLQTFGFVNSNQFKSVDNTKPTSNPDIRYSLTETDNKYFSAVESGDTETAQRMVDDSAKLNGYTRRMFHETDAKNIHIFDISLGTHGATDSETPYGIFTKSSAKNIGLGSRQMALYVKADNTLYVEDRADVKNKIPEMIPYFDEISRIDREYDALAEETEDAEFDALMEWMNENPDADMDVVYPNSYIINNQPADIDSQEYLDAFNEHHRIMEEWRSEYDKVAVKCKELITSYLRSNGYDSMYFEVDGGSRGRQTDSLILLDPNQVKSADAVTYDDNGNVIPLSERFNAKISDVVDNVLEQLGIEGNKLNFSITSSDSVPSTKGRIYGEDLMLQEAPKGVASATDTDIAPVQKTSVAEDSSGVVNEADYAPMTEAEANAMWEEQKDSIDTLTDADMPPEIEAPIYMDDSSSLDKKTLSNIANTVREALSLSKLETKAIQDIIQKYSTSEQKNEEALFEEIKAQFGEKSWTEKNEEIAQVKQVLRGFRINVSPTIKRDIPDYAQFRKRNFGKILFANDGMDVDKVYMTLSNYYPSLFPDSIANATDQLLQIAEVANTNAYDTRTDMLDDETIREATELISDVVNTYQENEILKGAKAQEREFLKNAKKYESEAPVFGDDFAPTKAQQKVAPTPMKSDDVEEKPTRRSELHQNIVDRLKGKFNEKGFDFDEVLSKAKDLSTFATVDNIPQRVMEKALGYKQGQILADETVNKVAQNESEGIKWLNFFTDRKDGLLAQISKQYNIKPGSKKSAAAQMYAEGFYVNKDNEIIEYGDKELAIDFPDVKVQESIKGLANDPRIRQIYDETLNAINESRSRNLYPEIPRLDNYFLHFRAMEDTFSRLGLPFNPNDIRAKDLPTDLNGVTADLKPGQPYFASAMHREGMRTSFDLLGGLERYLSSAKNQIYHIDDIQTLRALRNYIADTYGQAKGLESLDNLSEEDVQERIKQVYGSHLSTFAKFLNEEANVLAGKTTLIDRGLEGIIGRRGITFLNTINGQVGSNMVGWNISSSLTNFLPVAQTLAKGSKVDFTKAFVQTVSSKIGSIFGKTDSFVENNPTIIRRKGAERFYRTPFQKIGDTGYVLMSAVDDISTELIVRTKYNELVRKGMSEQKASFEADKWVSRLMGDRSLGQQPQLYNSKMLGLVTKFQLEVRNQLDSQFYDTIQEAKVSNEEIENKLLRNAKTAAKVASTFVQLAAVQHLYGTVFESIAGYNPAFDIVDVLIKALGFDDDEEDEDTVLDNLEEGFFALLEDLPYTSTFTGGRIPISSALPVSEFIKGVDQYGNEKSRWDTLKEVAPYYVLPTGYGQIKKTVKGLNMFSDEHPVAGSYTDSGNLRFPIDDTLTNRIQAGVFGQYASKNARTYFDEGYAPLKEKQIQEYKEADMPIADYWKYREGLKDFKTQDEKVAYINGLDISKDQKDVLKSYLYDVESYKKENPEKYAFLEREGIGFLGYKELDEDTQNAWSWAFKHQDEYEYYKSNGVLPGDYSTYYIPMLDFEDEDNDAYSWAYDNPEKATFSKAITDNVVDYRKITKELYAIRADKDENGNSISGTAKSKKKDYIWSLDIDDGAKYILFKNEYNSCDDYNYEIIDYLNSRDDISFDEMKTILTTIGFEVDDKGNISWD